MKLILRETVENLGESGEVVEFMNEEIERLQKEIAKSHNFELIDHNLVLYVRPMKNDQDA